MLPLRGFTQECEGRYQSVHGAGFTLAHLSPPESPSRDPYTCYTLRASPAVRSVCDTAQYVTLQTCFSHPSLVISFFCNLSLVKTETGTANR